MMDTLRTLLMEQGLDDRWVSALLAAGAGLVLVLLAIVADFVAKRILLRAVVGLIQRSRSDWDDTFLQTKVFDRLAHLAPALVFHIGASVAFVDYPQLVTLVETLAVIYMVLIGLSAIDGFLDAVLAIYRKLPVAKRIDIKVFLQVAKIIFFFMGGIFILSQLLGKSPLVFLSGLGAFTAVLMLIFKDAILGLAAGVQLMSNNMVRRGDWIEMPRFKADGDVIDVSLTTVKVQNWDKTISTIPTYALISDSFRNWRGMSESGGRRIKRSIALDMNTVRFCDEEMIQRFRRFQHLGEYLDRKLAEIEAYNAEHGVDASLPINGRRLTNVGTFRAYLEAYLRHHPKVHPHMTLLVRQLPPGPEGLPIEIYVFSNDQVWANYEAIQADIFDHILAVLPLFELRVFQSPSGRDFQSWQGAE